MLMIDHLQKFKNYFKSRINIGRIGRHSISYHFNISFCRTHSRGKYKCHPVSYCEKNIGSTNHLGKRPY